MSTDKSNVTQKSHALIVLLDVLHIPEQCWLPNVYFVYHNKSDVPLQIGSTVGHGLKNTVGAFEVAHDHITRSIVIL